MKTKSLKSDEIRKDWYVANAEGKTLGRFASEIAKVLRGKHKPSFTPHMDMGDFVVVINADKVKLTGRKETKKLYHHHTGWVGGLVTKTAEEVRAKAPEDLVKKAVWGMLPHGPLGRKMYTKLKVYAGCEHPHAAQKPEALAL